MIKKIAFNDTNYPSLLKETKGAPKELYYLGELPQKEPTIAIVGTRKATNDGLMVAKNISYDLARAGITIVSGLALGIDAASHEGALAAGGRTFAVLGNGLDIIYPHSHYNLAQKIISQGGIISEYPAGTPPYPNQFLERNRIVSGLSLAVIIVEAPIDSGALVTAKHALDQGREVFVAPGRAGHQNYEGSHMLLRNGARIVTSAKDVLEDLAETLEPYNLAIKKETKKSIQDEASLLILETIKNASEPLRIDKLVEITKLDPNVVGQKLTILQLDGFIEESNGKFKIIR